MNTRLSVEVLAPGALGAPELAAWRGFREAAPHLAGPYFAPEYSLAAEGVVPEAWVAVIHRGGVVDGFLPFQKRGGVAQPLGAPLTDYHGLIARPDAVIDLHAVTKTLGVSRFTFSGLKTADLPEGGRAFVHSCMTADVSGGLDSYLAGRPRTRKFFKDKQRRLRALEAEVGEVEFRFDDDAEAFDFVLGQKRAQYASTGRHDIFACGWTERFLRRLWETRHAEFGGRFTTLRAGGRLVAAEYGLHGGPVHHLWFPAYDPEYARFGPGTTMIIETVKAAAADPSLGSVDFGKAESEYKAMYAEPSGVVYEGSVDVASLRLVTTRAADAALAAPALKRISEARARLRRRFAVISACETTTTGWVAGAVTAFRSAARRPAAIQA